MRSRDTVTWQTKLGVTILAYEELGMVGMIVKSISGLHRFYIVQ